MDNVKAHLWGGPPASFSCVGGRRPRRPLPDDRNISEDCGKPAGGPAADQGVRPTNPTVQLIRGHQAGSLLEKWLFRLRRYARLATRATRATRPELSNQCPKGAVIEVAFVS